MKMANNNEFKGSTKQAISDMTDRLDRIENKLDTVLERTFFVAGVISVLVSVVVTLLKR